ncbi:membrane protein [Actinomycetota bacterium]|nr:membrane protein [Actinomycetota bacterium]
MIGAWSFVLVAVVAAYLTWGGSTSSSVTIPGTPTAEVTERLQDALPQATGGTGTVVLSTEDGAPFTAEQQTAISAVVQQAGTADGVLAVVDPFETTATVAERNQQIVDGQQQLATARTQPDRNTEQLDVQARQLAAGASLLEMSAQIRSVSPDGSTAVVTVAFDKPQLELTDSTLAGVRDAFEADPVPGVQMDFSADLIRSSAPLGLGELVGLLVAAITLMVMLGTVVAAGLPLLTALIGVGIAAAGTMALSGVVEMTESTPLLALMLGLAVGIDYSLFILNRHRRQLVAGVPVHRSIGLATGTSGNAVVFAGATVVIALLALNLTGIPFLGLMGVAAGAGVAIAVLVAVTFLPALLGLLGTRVLPRRLRAKAEHPHQQPAPAAAAMSTRRAVITLVVGVVALLTLAIPALDIRLGLPDGSSEDVSTTQYRAYSTVAEKFGPGVNGPLVVVADLPSGLDDTQLLETQARIGERLMAAPDVVAVAPIGTSADQRVTAFQVIPTDGPTSESTEALVHALRSSAVSDDLGLELGVAGSASGNIDISEKLADALPLYLTVVVGLSLIILILVFRSILVPLVATAGFVLSLFAALGAVVAIYQWGWLGALFGVHDPGPILNFLPTILTGVLFGLAMDYQIFLVSGMREAYAHGATARRAVTQGLHAGRSVVVAAALIMVSVFGGFVFSHLTVVRPIGFALAFGVLVDAFVVRMLIVPAIMHLAGDAAWWLPRWLDRLLPDVDVEGAALRRHHVTTTTTHEPQVVSSRVG